MNNNSNRRFFLKVFKLINLLLLLSILTVPAVFADPLTIKAKVKEIGKLDSAIAGESCTFSALVRNVTTLPLPAFAEVRFWVDGSDWSGSHWVGAVSVYPIGTFSERWFNFNWTVPANLEPGLYSYRAQVWDASPEEAISHLTISEFFMINQSLEEPSVTTVRVSVASGGTDVDGAGNNCSISADGRYIAFASGARLVPGDSGYNDIYVHDRTTGQNTRVSVASDGTQGNDSSDYPSISADGRYVAFDSRANNLVPNDTNGILTDIFVHDRINGQTTRVSVASDGTEGNSVSFNPSISADGRYVAFMSPADNLVPGDTNEHRDIFVHDRTTGQTTRVSVASDGTQGNLFSYSKPSISADGRYVAFSSSADNLVSDDTNGYEDVFVHDRTTGQTTRVSVASDGTQGNSCGDSPSISADGRYIAFTSNYSSILVHDRTTGQNTRVSVASDGTLGDARSSNPSISADGRYVAFSSDAENLVPGDTNEREDIFLHDRTTGQTTRVSVASDGTQGNADSIEPSVSANGRYVAYETRANNLVPDNNYTTDVLVSTLLPGETEACTPAFWLTQTNPAPTNQLPEFEIPEGSYKVSLQVETAVNGQVGCIDCETTTDPIEIAACNNPESQEYEQIEFKIQNLDTNEIITLGTTVDCNGANQTSEICGPFTWTTTLSRGRYRVLPEHIQQGSGTQSVGLHSADITYDTENETIIIPILMLLLQ